jgi:cytoskeleton-associated protein 5
VVETAAKCLGLLGRGLRKDFAPHAKAVIRILLEKLKEKKPSTVIAIQEALSNMIPHCFTLVDVMEDIEAASQSKVPQAKKELLVFVTKLLKVTQRNILQKQTKQLCNMFMTVMIILLLLLSLSLSSSSIFYL